TAQVGDPERQTGVDELDLARRELVERRLYALGAVGRLRDLVRQQADLLPLQLLGQPRERLARAREARVRAPLAKQVRRPGSLLRAPLGVDVPPERRNARLGEQVRPREQQRRDG